MFARLRSRRPSHSTVVAYLALFVALGGTGAYAANTVFSTDIVDGEVKTADLATDAVGPTKLKAGAVTTDKLDGGAVTTDKVKEESLTGSDVLNNSLRGADIDESTLSSIGGGGPAGGDLTGSYPNPLIRPNAVGGADIADNSLGGNDIDESTLGEVPSAKLGGVGRWTSPDGGCNPETNNFTTCAFTSITLPARTQVLLIGAAKAQAEDGDGGQGECLLATHLQTLHESVSGFAVGGQLYDLDRHVPLIAIVYTGPGAIDFAIRCREVSGKVRYFDAAVAAVALSPN